MSHLQTTRDIIGQMLAVENQALRAENAELRRELAASERCRKAAEQRHESLTALVIAEAV